MPYVDIIPNAISIFDEVGFHLFMIIFRDFDKVIFDKVNDPPFFFSNFQINFLFPESLFLT
jgi:hypothetical protein